MQNFEIDSQLTKDNYILGELESSVVILMNNKVAPWFILVPKVTGVSELYELESHIQVALMSDINRLSSFLKKYFSPDKLNVAAIGNIVKQLHIHLVARTEGDHCWPGVVWGTDYSESYTEQEISQLTTAMLNQLAGFAN